MPVHMQDLRNALLLLTSVGIAALPEIILFQETFSPDSEYSALMVLSILAGLGCGVLLRSWWTMAVIPVGTLIPIACIYATSDLGNEPLPFGFVATLYLMFGALPAMIASIPGVRFGRFLVSHSGPHGGRGHTGE